jgi:predicted nucleic acid-binding protein
LSREPRLWVVDTSILIGYFRAKRYGEFLGRELSRRSVFVPGVVFCELYAGAMTRGDRTDIEALRREIGEKIVNTDVNDWLMAGRCLTQYAERWGRIRPRDHLADVLVAVAAARLRATVVAEDLRGMTRWAWALRRFGVKLRVESVTP